MIDGTIAARVFGRAARIVNRAGRGPFVIVCDHASNRVPKQYGRLGLGSGDMKGHIAWDPGAAAVSRLLSRGLDCPLVESTVSRLVIDCNRPLDAPDLIAEVSETTAVPGNARLGQAERRRRIAGAHVPFHDAVDLVVSGRVAAGTPTALVAIHTFTPVYHGRPRPWHVGVIHDDDLTLACPVLARLSALKGIVVGDNEPYSPADRVYYTLERHARSRGLPCVMIEIRNDEVRDRAGQDKWADRLASILRNIEPRRLPKPPPARNAQAIEGTL
jgi:predicted N-formylglutamate amidohydrolase